MTDPHDETNRIQALVLQIDVLQRNLHENERSWIASGLGMIHNTVAERLRGEIAEKEALLIFR